MEVSHRVKETAGLKELAKDVAAFANHIGGIIVVGMADTKGVPTKFIMDSDVSDAHQRHLQQAVAHNTAPPVRVETRAVDNPATPGRGSSGSGRRAVGLSGCRAVGLSGCRAVGLSGCRAVGLSGCRAVGLSA
ncbi:AlbA family DNA-binding domain-containing protein [Streptomyces sp. SD15]